MISRTDLVVVGVARAIAANRTTRYLETMVSDQKHWPWEAGS